MKALADHSIITASEKGWDKLTNGALLKAAEEHGVELLLTPDRRIQYQQNLRDRKIAIGVLTGTPRWSRVRLHFDMIAETVNRAQPGSYAELEIPFPSKRDS